MSGEVPPPWVQHPEIPWGSIGWRMGYGESTIMRWHAWLEQQPRDREHRVAYLRRYLPAPRPWAATVASVLEPEDDYYYDEPDDYDAANEACAVRLAAEGLVGDDVGMAAWEALHGEAPAAPWEAAWHDGKLGHAARYSGRALTFWARWGAARREDGRLAAWLRRVPAPAPAWEPLHHAVQHGAVPTGGAATSSWERLAVAIAAHARPPAPWQLGAPASSLQQAYEDDSSDADAWCSWVYDAIDDGNTWRAYLAEHGPVPEPWRETIERVIGIGG